MRIEGCETHGRWRERAGTQNRCAEIHARVEKRRWRSEVVGLLRFRENERDVVPLVAPRVEIDWGEKDSVGRMKYQAHARKVFGNSQTGRKVVLVGVHQPSRVTQLTADEYGRNSFVENQVCVRVVLVVERAGVLIAQTNVDCRRGCHLPAIFSESPHTPGTQIHLRYASLALFHGGEAEQHAGQSGAAAIIKSKFRGVPGGVLVVAAILEESPHWPEVTVKFPAELHAVATTLPSVGIPHFKRSVPGMHRRCRESVADPRVSLCGEPGSTPGVLSAEADSLNT